MTKILPSLYGYSEENIKDKIEYLRSVDLEFIVLENTKNLMQSVKLTYARYEYLTNEKNLLLDYNNYTKLFMGEKQFKKQYGITKAEILEKYDYDLNKNSCIKK